MALEHLPLDKVRANADQPRKSFYQESLEELAASIKERGVLEPIVVRPLKGDKAGFYEIVMGERRYRASKLAGMETIPAIVREYNDDEAAADALLENFQREDLNPVEKARAVEQLLQMMSYEKVCKVLGVSETTVRRLLELLELPPQVQQELISRPGVQSVFNESHARALAQLSDDPEIQIRLTQKIKAEKMTVNALEQLISALKNIQVRERSFCGLPAVLPTRWYVPCLHRRSAKSPTKRRPQKSI